ncbi:CinA family protein [Nakamurella sp. YIM 132084]|uniref:CinA family protein n=1 Tax=Nakamurella leprariae TaxID=2803911 RepID=A0A938YAZ4_9ACTN|nr:CinA family protein [Nakamurella leprariae]MBM9466459.1 CinA family protein [Nakamurella leprariae]
MSSNPSPDVAERIAELAQQAGVTVACAESLTGGQIATALAAAPDSSAWFRGGIVAYASEVKHDLLEVPPGPVVCEESARTMAATTAKLLGADVVVAVTGVGGPDPQDDQPPGTVWFALRSGDGVESCCLDFDGDPPEIVERTTAESLRRLHEHLRP